jgi:hypothetical protein
MPIEEYKTSSNSEHEYYSRDGHNPADSKKWSGCRLEVGQEILGTEGFVY